MRYTNPSPLDSFTLRSHTELAIVYAMKPRHLRSLATVGLLLTAGLLWFVSRDNGVAKKGTAPARVEKPEISERKDAKPDFAEPSSVTRKEKREEENSTASDAKQLTHDVIACLRSADVDERQRLFLEILKKMRARFEKPLPTMTNKEESLIANGPLSGGRGESLIPRQHGLHPRWNNQS